MKSTMRYYLLLMGLFLLLSCDQTPEYPEDLYDIDIGTEEVENFPDGTYCADIEYYNPNTGTRANYTLNVEVEYNELTVIYWLNGGWLDDDHFYPEELDEYGYCSFVSDRGCNYSVQITDVECSFNDAKKAEMDYQRAIDEITCDGCGGDKDPYEHYCYSCTDEIEHTCARCGQYDPFMFSLDDYCSDCEDELEED